MSIKIIGCFEFLWGFKSGYENGYVHKFYGFGLEAVFIGIQTAFQE
jgi:hypothetical protein